jgi:hypothetical protein
LELPVVPTTASSRGERLARTEAGLRPERQRRSYARLLLPSIADLLFIALLVSLSYGLLATRLLGDGGTGWHVRNGQEILSTHVLPRTDPFSSTMSGKPWYAWEWMYDAVIGGIYNAVGLNGVVFFSAFLIALTFALLFRLQLVRGTNLLVAIVFFLLAASASTIHFLARPHIITWLFTLVWLEVLDTNGGEDRRGRERILFWLPCLMLLWANLHGGFLMGFVLLGIYLVAAGIRVVACGDVQMKTAARKRVRMLVVITLLSFGASLVNPYGYRLYSHLDDYLRNHFLMNHIQEFQSPDFHSLAPRCFLVLLLLAFFSLAMSARRLKPSEILLVLFATYSGLYASRNIPIASMLIVLVIAPIFSDWLNETAVRDSASALPRKLASRIAEFGQRMREIEKRQRGHLWPIVAVVLSGWICLHDGLGSRHLMKAQFDAGKFPVQATDVIRAEAISEPIFTLDSWGGYLIYRLYPRTKVVVDDRHDLYGEEFLKKYLKVVHAEPGWEEILKQWDANWVLVPADSALSGLLQDAPGWKNVHRDNVAALFHRANARYCNVLHNQAGNRNLTVYRC